MPTHSRSLRLLLLLAGCVPDPCCGRRGLVPECPDAPTTPENTMPIPRDATYVDDGSVACIEDVMRGAARDQLMGDCENPEFRREHGGPFHVPARVRLRIIVTRKDEVAIVTRGQVADAIAEANMNFEPSGIQLVMHSYEVSTTIPKDVDESIAADPIFALAPTLPVLLVERLDYYEWWAGGVAWIDGSGVVVATNGRPAILSHELGHALGLHHTNLDGPDGDHIEDTPFDPGPGSCSVDSGCSTTACDECTATCSAPFEAAAPDPRLIMGPYFSPPPTTCLRFSEGQNEAMRCVLRNKQRRLTDTQCLDPCPNDRTCVRGSCVCKDTECNGRCVTLGTPENCRTCGDACGDDEVCSSRTAGCKRVPSQTQCVEDCEAESRACHDACDAGIVNDRSCKSACTRAYSACLARCPP